LGARKGVVRLDGEVSNSTHADEFGKAYPDRFFEMYIAEQQLVASAVGLQVRRYIPFVSTFAAFFSRAYDFIRMAAISQANLRLSGSHAGTEIGADGPSQMALEVLASKRAIEGSTVLYPSDATTTAQLVAQMADQSGIVYMRTTRGAYPVLYDAKERFKIGGSKVLRRSASDQVALIGAGVTLYECLKAADTLAKAKIKARVIDLYSLKPLDVATLREASRVTGGRLVVVEDHYPQGGLGAAVMEALSEEERPPRIRHLAVRGLPGSGRPAELLDAAGISASHIVAAARSLAADVIRPAYDRTRGADGFVSIEVAPALAHDTAATIDMAKFLWSKVERPNLMVKVPATLEGIPAIRRLVADGVNINVTLIFALS